MFGVYTVWNPRNTKQYYQGTSTWFDDWWLIAYLMVIVRITVMLMVIVSLVIIFLIACCHRMRIIWRQNQHKQRVPDLVIKLNGMK